MKPRLRIALLIDPRFPGGTSASVAAAMRALDRHADLRVVALESRMFTDRAVNPALQAALADLGLDLEWNPALVRADVAVVHNPSFLRADERLETRISCRQAFVVTHENFLRPNGSEGFDVGRCLALIDSALICGRRWLAPISAQNRRGVEAWVAQRGSDWEVADFDWFNICDFAMQPPTASPRDRRGRHSRPNFEKFPPLETMRAHFPPHAESCAILGADYFLLDPSSLPRHWKALRFREVEVGRFLQELDFFVYYTHPLWRESFGRAIAEAIAAGKVVITDPATAETFGDAVVASDGGDVDEIIRGFVAAPRRYVAFVRAAQQRLERFRPTAFTRHLLENIGRTEAMGHALL